ncbi:DUF3152 domain-containing protein [Streptomyces sp. RM72]|uniref:DUF3152 domain-containing protein n=1 Tax=unclassified Streptomyces TaxID=2593676 RepID=UPI000EF5F458|nr:DUF3152 domain-containing protein [Streptomyces sp. RM72]
MSRQPASTSRLPSHRSARSAHRRRSGRNRQRRVGRTLIILFLAAVALSVPFLSRYMDGGPGVAGAVAKEQSRQTPPPVFTRSSAAAQADTDGFVTARVSAAPIGTGTVRRFKVRVEEGIGLSADRVAREVYGILADRRSWTADGHDSFQLVSEGSRDFVVVIASPATVDRICGAAGLKTRGEVNCDVGSRVIVNLKRWQTGSPNFHGSLADYRALIINHEVGHRIGHGHETCPGPGRPAPAMMQQIDGLHGCKSNAWPYDGKGTYLGGPKVP